MIIRGLIVRKAAGCQRAGRRHPRPHAGDRGAGRLRALTGRGAGPARPHAAVPGRADARVADLEAREQAGEWWRVSSGPGWG